MCAGAGGDGRHGLRRAQQRIREHDGAGDHRPDESGEDGADGRGGGRLAPHDRGGRRRRPPQGGQPRGGDARRHGGNGRDGRHGRDDVS